jgi:hypothetical protein
VLSLIANPVACVPPATLSFTAVALPRFASAVLPLTEVALPSWRLSAVLSLCALAVLPSVAVASLCLVAMAEDVLSDEQVLLPLLTLIVPFWLTQTSPAARAPTAHGPATNPATIATAARADLSGRRGRETGRVRLELGCSTNALLRGTGIFPSLSDEACVRAIVLTAI